MINNITLDHITLFIILTGFVPFFTWRAIRAFNRKRYTKFAWCIVLNLFMVRLGFLRVSTQGGKVGFDDPSTLQFTKELGNSSVFFIATIILLIFAVIRVLDDDRYISKAYIEREKYDLLVQQLAALRALRGEEVKKNEPQ